MFLKGMELQKEIPSTINGLIGYIDNFMKEDEKKEEFYKRKFTTKGSTELRVLEFINLEPITFRLITYKWDELSITLRVNNDLFHPLFFGMGISNGQYRKLVGPATGHLYKNLNSGSYSDYYITRKYTNKTGPKDFQDLVINGSRPLEVNSEIQNESLKFQILMEFYQVVCQDLSDALGNEPSELGYEYFINFNSLLSLSLKDNEIEAFLTKLFHETGLSIPFNWEEIKQKKTLNALVYAVENALFLWEKVFKRQIPETPNYSINKLLTERVELNFEVPTPEKPLLKNARSHSTSSQDEFPTATFLEMFLNRTLVAIVNKQGDTDESGYRFLIKDEVVEIESLTKEMQIVCDKNGNFSMREIAIIDIREEKKMNQRMLVNYEGYYPKDPYTGRSDEITALFSNKLNRVLDAFCIRQPDERSSILEYYKKRLYKKAGKRLEDGVYRNLSQRIAAYAVEKKEIPPVKLLLDLLFVQDTLLGTLHYNRKVVNVLNQSEMLKENLNEPMTPEETLYYLGKIGGIAARSSRNKESLVKKLLRQSTVDGILAVINHRIESGYDDIEQANVVGLLSFLMDKQRENLAIRGQSKLTNFEKYSYIAGVLKEVRTPKKEAEEMKNDAK
ncbi:hypothetical protein [Bacillus sp. AFS088145]|uniref:hypothetical protein n=1 Tax=Bacillus sp. AFS088145 TaxID=2033514 RepID=UPI000BF943B6|nr:hypothetical protein [Bacillus sp. AFS088145]PFH91394.1 hypothetical protein COI44_01960 [Bacillus sp. AFS088145]